MLAFRDNLASSYTNIPSQDCALSCDDESGKILSNWHSIEIWSALERLAKVLFDESNFSRFNELFTWKESRHIALAREPYAWRAAIEEIKAADIVARCAGEKNREVMNLMSDKPAMLKIAGEITNSLMHSYTSRHRMSFVQRVSKVPSWLAL